MRVHPPDDKLTLRPGNFSTAVKIEGESVVEASGNTEERRIPFPQIRSVHIGPCDLGNMFVRIRSDSETIWTKVKPIQFDELAGWLVALRQGLRPYWSNIKFGSGNLALFYSMIAVLFIAPVVFLLSCIGIYLLATGTDVPTETADYRTVFVAIGLSVVLLVYTMYKASRQLVRAKPRKHDPEAEIMPYYLAVHTRY